MDVLVYAHMTSGNFSVFWCHNGLSSRKSLRITEARIGLFANMEGSLRFRHNIVETQNILMFTCFQIIWNQCICSLRKHPRTLAHSSTFSGGSSKLVVNNKTVGNLTKIVKVARSYQPVWQKVRAKSVAKFKSGHARHSLGLQVCGERTHRHVWTKRIQTK